MSRSTNKRSLGTFAALLLVPAAAAAFLSVGLGTASGDTAPSGVLVSESRAVAFTGDNFASAPAVVTAEEKKVDEVLNDWQNTVRRRTRSPR